MEAMQDFLCNLTIAWFPNQDIILSSEHIKAISHAQGVNLPTNAPTCVLWGFAAANNSEFVTTCNTMMSQLDSSFFADQFSGYSTYRKVVVICDDLEHKILNICADK